MYNLNIITTTSTGNFTWNINASLKNAKGMLFTFRDSTTQTQSEQSLTNRTSLGMLQAQLTIGSYTFPANRYLLYDCSQSIASSADTTVTYPGFANFINYWMSAMKFFGQGIDKESTCSTNFDQFTRCFNNGAAQTNGSFVLAFNLEGLHDSDDEFRSCIPLDGNTTALNFTTGIASDGTTNIECFIMYEFDVVISQGVAVATNKYNDFSNDTLK